MSTRIEFENLINTRDLGGMKTNDGRVVKHGKLIRSGQLHVASEKDKERLGGLLSEIVDFRTDQELYEKPDPYFKQVEFHHIPILTSWTAGITWEQGEELSQDEVILKLQSDADLAFEYMKNIYKGFASNAFYVSQYRKFIDVLLKEREGALLWHCTVGKDRAGFGTVLVQELLGIDRKDILNDYMKTALFIGEEVKAQIMAIKKEYPMPGAVSDKAIHYMFNVERDFLEASYEKIELLYGSVEAFLKDALKVKPEEIEKIREMYLV